MVELAGVRLAATAPLVLMAHFATLIGRCGPGRGYPVRHGAQTDAMLIDDRWCELFATIPVEVAVVSGDLIG